MGGLRGRAPAAPLSPLGLGGTGQLIGTRNFSAIGQAMDAEQGQAFGRQRLIEEKGAIALAETSLFQIGTVVTGQDNGIEMLVKPDFQPYWQIRVGFILHPAVNTAFVHNIDMATQ